MICSWCKTDSEEAARRHEGPHATWCVHFREEQRGGIHNGSQRPTYEGLLDLMRKYVIDQKECGNPATMKDLREYRSWKNMPQDAEYDRALLEEIERAST